MNARFTSLGKYWLSLLLATITHLVCFKKISCLLAFLPRPLLVRTKFLIFSFFEQYKLFRCQTPKTACLPNLTECWSLPLPPFSHPHPILSPSAHSQCNAMLSDLHFFVCFEKSNFSKKDWKARTRGKAQLFLSKVKNEHAKVYSSTTTTPNDW